MNIPIVNHFKNNNEVFNNLPHKVHHQEYYIAPQSKPKGQRATFHAALKLTIIIGQCFGLLPVLGVCDVDTSKLRFTFFSGRCLYSILSIIGQGGMLMLCILKLVKDTDGVLSTNNKLSTWLENPYKSIHNTQHKNYNDYELKIWHRCFCWNLYFIPNKDDEIFRFLFSFLANSDYQMHLATLVFYASNSFTTVLYLKMATKWPRLCQQISKTEAADPNMDASLIKRCNISCILVLSLAIVEHILSDISGLAIAIDCQPERNLFDAFLLQSFPWVWTFLPFNRLNGFICTFLNLQCTFNWNFADAFVICISWYLTSRLEQINKRIQTVRGKCVPSSFWRTMREDYSRAANLVRRVDDVISGIIFISFANNLFFICLQLLHTLEEGIKRTPACHRNPDERPMNGYEQAVYFVYSFSFLLVRSLAVSLVAARVHTASRTPAQELYDVPSSAYCTEVQRFLSQIHGDSVSLSGLQFFSVKRGLVLTTIVNPFVLVGLINDIAGTIVTYELVLMQFAGVTPTVAPSVGPVVFLPSETTTPS